MPVSLYSAVPTIILKSPCKDRALWNQVLIENNENTGNIKSQRSKVRFRY